MSERKTQLGSGDGFGIVDKSREAKEHQIEGENSNKKPAQPAESEHIDKRIRAHIG